jgi:hypothetical protein
MQQNDLLTNLILARGLIAPRDVFNDKAPAQRILDDETLLARVAAIDQGAFEAVIGARINAIADDLIGNASPAEVIIFRQAIVEITTTAADLEKYRAEHKRREDAKKANTQPGSGEAAYNNTANAEVPEGGEGVM